MRALRGSLGGPRSIVLALTLSSLAITPLASAQTDEQRSGARAAATAGGKAYLEGRWEQAIDLFTRAESLVHSPVHLLYMARAYEKVGQLVRARESYIRITNEDLAAAAPQPYKDAKRDAEKELAALEPRIPSVSVIVNGAGPAWITATMDGQAIPPALIGVPRPVDPGERRFEAAAEGFKAEPVVLKVEEGRNETVVLELKPTGAPIPAAAPAATGAPAAAPPPGSGAPPRDSGTRGPSPLTWVAYGVGVVGLGVGTVFALKASSKIDEANGLCNQRGPDGASDWCSPGVSSLDDEARSARTMAIVGFAVGGVGVAAGTVLLFTTQKKDDGQAAFVSPFIGLGSAGVRGRF